MTPPAQPAPPVVAPRPTAPTSTPRPARRVAPTPEAPPPPDAEVAPERTETTTPDPTPTPEIPPVEETPPTAPEEAAPEIVTEAETPDDTPEPPSASNAAPEQSLRPAKRPARPVRTAETPTTPQTPPARSETDAERRDAAVREALEGINDATPSEASTPETAPVVAEPSGPPLTFGEKDALRVAVQKCWNLGAMSSQGMETRVVVAVAMNRDGKTGYWLDQAAVVVGR